MHALDAAPGHLGIDTPRIDEPGFDWIDLPIHGPYEPLHERGLVPTQPSLYFVGLHFLRPVVMDDQRRRT